MGAESCLLKAGRQAREWECGSQELGWSGSTEPAVTTMPAAASYGSLRCYLSIDVSKKIGFQ